MAFLQIPLRNSNEPITHLLPSSCLKLRKFIRLFNGNGELRQRLGFYFLHDLKI